MLLLELRRLCCRRGGRLLVDSVSLSLAAGEWLTVAGRNGSGKTTLIRLLLGLEHASGGEVLWLGQSVGRQWTSMRRQLGVVLQHPEEQILGQTLLADVALGLPEGLASSLEWQAQRQQQLEHFGLWPLRHLNPADLSGGQRSLLALSAALLRQPLLLVLDEPFASLDFPAVRLAVRALLAARSRGVAIVMVAHHLEPFLAHCDRLLLLEEGRMLCDAPPQQALAFAEQAGVHTPLLPLERCSWVL